MAIFTNQATLSYNNTVTTSNIVTGEVLEVLSAIKNSLDTQYRYGDTVTYVISINNTGVTAFNNLTIKDDLGFAKYKWKMNVKHNTIFHKITITDGKSKIVEKYHEYYHDLNTILDPRFKVISVTTDFKEDYSEDDERILVVLQK